MKKIFVVDVMAMAFRSFHAFSRRPLSNSKGFPTSAIFGCAMFLMKLIEDEKPDYLVMACDSKGETFRHKIYADYKANRGTMPEDLSLQIPEIFRLFSLWNLPLIKMDSFEADDIMGSIAHQWSDPETHCYLVSGDKDFMQLINSHVFLYSPKKGGICEKLGTSGVEERYNGCKPNQVVDMMSLWGDSSDHIPGVAGIGAKGAASLIYEFGSLDQLYANIDQVRNKRQKDKLLEQKDQAYLSKRLVEIKLDLELPMKLKESLFDAETALGQVALLSFFEEMGFDALAKRIKNNSQDEHSEPQNPILDKKKGPEFVDQKKNLNKVNFNKDLETEAHPIEQNAILNSRYKIVRTKIDFELFNKSLSAATQFAFDTETTGLDVINDHPIGISFAFPNRMSYYIPLLDKHLEDLSVDFLNTSLQAIFAEPTRQKIAHNLKFDLQMLKNQGIEIRGPIRDSMLLAFIADSGRRTYGLDSLSKDHLNFEKTPTTALIGKKGQISMSDVDLDTLGSYACEDALCSYLLHETLIHTISNEQLSVYTDIELPLVAILADMEQTGIGLDTSALHGISEALFGEMERLEKEIFALASREFNINSPKQLQEVLYTELKLHEQIGKKRIKKTKSGLSTDVSVLEMLSFHPLPAKVLEFRTVSKLKNTYVDTLPQLVNQTSMRIHSSFHQTGTMTGRLSSSHPNLQNIPIRSSQGREIRKAFIASDENLIISADYSQIELRILAHMSGDEALREAFSKDADIHTATAASMFKKDISDVDSNDRSRAKAINYGIIYGMGPQRLARTTGVKVPEAKQFIERYFNSFPGIKDFIEKVIEAASEKGFSETMCGRRRPIAGLDGSLGALGQANAKNMAINSPIQGSAADLMKKAMIHIKERLDTEEFKAKMLLQVHDELVFECPRDEKEALIAMVNHEMNHALDLSVPLKTDIGCGSNWLEAH